MKLVPRTFRIFMDVHTWAGVIASLLLYVMFFAGGFALFLHELELWGEPFAQRPAAMTAADVERALDALASQTGPKVRQIHLTLPHGTHGVSIARYRDPRLGQWVAVGVDPTTGTLQPERERLGRFLYYLHFLWHDAALWLYTVAGLLAVTLLLALVTGVLVQLKHLGRQLHRFRPDRKLRLVWSDMHKVLGIMGLPFQLVVAFTGAFIVLGPWIITAFVGPVFSGDSDRAARLLHGGKPANERASGRSAVALPLASLIARAQEAVPHLEPRSFLFRHRGDEHGIVDVEGTVASVFYGSAWVRLRAHSGEILASRAPDREGAFGALRRWIYGLHMAGYGGPWLRVLYALLAVGTCLTILTGNWIWLARRERRRAHAGNRLLERLTAGIGGGVLVATAVLFVASRVLPFDLPHRGRVEEGIFLATLAAMIGWALVARDATPMWWRLCALAGALFAVAPLLAARLSSAGLFGATGDRITPVVVIDVVLLVAGAALGTLAWKLRAASAFSHGGADPNVATGVLSGDRSRGVRHA